MGEDAFEYILKRRKGQKRVNMIIRQDGTLVVTAPKLVPRMMIEQVLRKHKVWITEKKAAKKQRNTTVDDAVVRHMKKVTQKIIEEKLPQFNAHYNFAYKRISVRFQRSRWGSCSSRGTLSFNCKIVALPEDLRDYIVVHELCHLQEMNHSQNFWNLVAQRIPDYKERRKRLKSIVI